MDKLKVRYVNIITLFLVSVFNTITAIIKHWNYERFSIFVVPFVIVLFICLYVKKYELDAALFFLITQLCILAGAWGNLSAALFLCFAIYCIKDFILICMFIILTGITIALKFVFFLENSTVIEMGMYCIGMAYALIIYYIIMHPKQKFHLEEDIINTRILGYLIQGMRYKEIGDIINMSEDAIGKRAKTMRKKYKCGNNMQLIFKIVENGGIRQN